MFPNPRRQVQVMADDPTAIATPLYLFGLGEFDHVGRANSMFTTGPSG